MKNIFFFLMLSLVTLIFSCEKHPKAQEIVDKSMAVCGSHLWETSDVSFQFRDHSYLSKATANGTILFRTFENDSVTIEDELNKMNLSRYVNDSLVQVPDSMAVKYRSSINSVHYFVKLPYGLNDAAVNKAFLGEAIIKGKDYYKVKITFDEENGGEDFEDVYVYWFNKESYKPDYLAYEFHVDGGGLRFREAFNERYVDGIRFVDYRNYEASPENTTVYVLDSLFNNSALNLLSKIELNNIEVFN